MGASYPQGLTLFFGVRSVMRGTDPLASVGNSPQNNIYYIKCWYSCPMVANSHTSVPIKAVSYETSTWAPRHPEVFSRAEVVRQTGDFHAAIPAIIADWSPQFSAEVASDVEDASRELAEFDRHARIVLGSSNPALGPMSAILLRTESRSSSQIERLTTSAKQLALAELGEGERSNAHVVVGNVRAMEVALRLAHDLSEESILQMHHALMIHQPNVGLDEAGVYRQEFVWLGEGEAGPRTADFVPPHPDRVPRSMADLMEFLGRQNLPILVQVAVGHAQFETIHPFVDGNGRTGRALVQSVLKNKGMVSGMAVPISAGLLTDIDRYFAALGSFRAGDAGPISVEFARASRMAAVSGRRLLDHLSDALEDSRAKLTGVRSDAAAWKVLPALVAQPVMTAKHLIETLGLGEMAALRTLNLLTERGVLSEVTGQRRNRIFEHGDILRVLDDYARGIKRATGRVAVETRL